MQFAVGYPINGASSYGQYCGMPAWESCANGAAGFQANPWGSDCSMFSGQMQNLYASFCMMQQMEMMLSQMMGGMSNGQMLAPALGLGQQTNNGCAPAGPTRSNPTQEPHAGSTNLTWNQAAELVRKAGGQVNPGGRPTVLALRSSNTATRNYGDTYLVLQPNGQIENFAGTTRPSHGGRDKAMLKPGNYEISPRWRDGKFNNDGFMVKSANGSLNVGVARDSNGDGVYSDGEMARNCSSDTIRLHRGHANTTSSAGCLNVQNYDEFLGAVGGRDASFNLVLVNV